MNGGTDAQRAHWLPRLASGEELAAVAVTEPDFGSDVAGITTTATRVDGGWVVNGTKTWCTFAARATVLMLLVRTDPDRATGHRGLSVLLVAEARRRRRTGSASTRPRARRRGPGRLEGRPIDTIGYRGMHSYELSFEDFFVADDCLVGGDGGLGPGVLPPDGRFRERPDPDRRARARGDAGRLRRGGRLREGSAGLRPRAPRLRAHAREAGPDGRDHPVRPPVRLRGRAPHGDRARAALEASMAKAYVCRAAEWVTREAMQIHGGMGYAEEYAVSRYFVDARVLSIFEGADETLCLKVIARRLVEGALSLTARARIGGPVTPRARRG